MVVVGGRGGAVIYSVGEGGRDGGREREKEGGRVGWRDWHLSYYVDVHYTRVLFSVKQSSQIQWFAIC